MQKLLSLSVLALLLTAPAHARPQKQARSVGVKVQEKLGRTAGVENQAGACGITGAALVKRGAAAVSDILGGQVARRSRFRAGRLMNQLVT